MNLYTIILDYDGGTYLSQVSAIDVPLAVRAWADKIVTDKYIPGKSVRLAKGFVRKLDDEDAIAPLEDLIGVWCLTTLIADKLALMNIVKTDY